MKDPVVITLQNAIKLRESRNAEYAGSRECYKMQGDIIQALFPDGIQLEDGDSHGRFAIINVVAGKLARYCNNFYDGGHDDSLDDIIVYAGMLKDLDHQGD